MIPQQQQQQPPVLVAGFVIVEPLDDATPASPRVRSPLAPWRKRPRADSKKRETQWVYGVLHPGGRLSCYHRRGDHKLQRAAPKETIDIDLRDAPRRAPGTTATDDDKRSLLVRAQCDGRRLRLRVHPGGAFLGWLSALYLEHLAKTTTTTTDPATPVDSEGHDSSNDVENDQQPRPRRNSARRVTFNEQPDITEIENRESSTSQPDELYYSKADLAHFRSSHGWRKESRGRRHSMSEAPSRGKDDRRSGTGVLQLLMPWRRRSTE